MSLIHAFHENVRGNGPTLLNQNVDQLLSKSLNMQASAGLASCDNNVSRPFPRYLEGKLLITRKGLKNDTELLFISKPKEFYGRAISI